MEGEKGDPEGGSVYIHSLYVLYVALCTNGVTLLLSHMYNNSNQVYTTVCMAKDAPFRN